MPKIHRRLKCWQTSLEDSKHRGKDFQLFSKAIPVSYTNILAGSAGNPSNAGHGRTPEMQIQGKGGDGQGGMHI